jgi:hypothetical protein
METSIETRISLHFDPSENEVLGVLGKAIHIKSHGFIVDTSKEIDLKVGVPYSFDEISQGVEDFDCILIIPRKEYIRIWNLWLDGKKAYCERYSEYCGVMGSTVAEDFEEVENTILNVWNEEKENYIETPTRTFIVRKFEDNCDFEHG